MAFQITKTAGIYEINVCVWSLKQKLRKRLNESAQITKKSILTKLLTINQIPLLKNIAFRFFKK